MYLDSPKPLGSLFCKLLFGDECKTQAQWPSVKAVAVQQGWSGGVSPPWASSIRQTTLVSQWRVQDSPNQSSSESSS